MSWAGHLPVVIEPLGKIMAPPEHFALRKALGLGFATLLTLSPKP